MAAADRSPLGSRLEKLLTDLDAMLRQPYAFDVFAPGSVNFGVLTTYRQTWRSQSYQVGDLVATMPLAPKEVQRYTTRRVEKRSRARKEVDDNLRTQRTDTTDTGRAESEIVEKATRKSNFRLTANESFGSDETMKVTAEQVAGRGSASDSRLPRWRHRL